VADLFLSAASLALLLQWQRPRHKGQKSSPEPQARTHPEPVARSTHPGPLSPAPSTPRFKFPPSLPLFHRHIHPPSQNSPLPKTQLFHRLATTETFLSSCHSSQTSLREPTAEFKYFNTSCPQPLSFRQQICTSHTTPPSSLLPIHTLNPRQPSPLSPTPVQHHQQWRQ
jgi:hypothetical protein